MKASPVFFHSENYRRPFESICQLTRARYLSILRFEKFQSNMSMKAPLKDRVTPERLMQFGSSYAPPLIIGAAVSNKVFDTLARGPKTIDGVSKETGAAVSKTLSRGVTPARRHWLII